MFDLIKLFAVGAVLAMSGNMSHAQETGVETQRQITVTGTGIVSAAPDVLRINVGVQAEASDASDAVRDMSARLESVIQTLTDAGLSTDDVQTNSVRLNPRFRSYNESGEQPDIAGFVASSDLMIVLRDIARTGAVLDAIVAVGVNQINGLQFDIEARDDLMNQARVAAVEDALAKTALYASAASVQTGAILSMHEATTVQSFPGAMSRMEARDVPIAAGTLELSAQVTVVTALE